MSSSASSDVFPQRLVELVEKELEALRDGVDGAIGEPDRDEDLAGWRDAFRYPLLAGGKRLRPVLLLATAEALGDEPARLLPAAAALECIHTFSLVHDDLPAIDDDDLRRGRPTTHVEFGEGVAVLVGDALLNAAPLLLARRQSGTADERLAAIAVLARATDGMIRGQYLDIEGDPSIETEDGLRRLCALKTGCLLEAAIELALVLAGAPSKRAAPFRALGREIGVGFQIVDDVLDATGSDEALGKRAGHDVATGKRTHVTVLGLERAQTLAAASAARAEALLAALPPGGDTSSLVAVVRRIYQRDR